MNPLYHITVYLDSSCNCDAGYYHATHNVRLSGEELIAFNRRVSDVQAKIEKDFEERRLKFSAQVYQLQREGKSTRNVGREPHKPELNVTILRLEESVIDGDAMLENFNTFVKSEGLDG